MTDREIMRRARWAMVCWAADQHDDHIYEDARHAFNLLSDALGLPRCDHLGVPQELHEARGRKDGVDKIPTETS